MNDSSRLYDYILVGGGLQSGLITLALKHHQPGANVLLIERSGELGGNHTWSFHPSDVPASAQPWVEPLVKHRWSHYHVRLDRFHRRVNLPYASIPSSHFASVIEQALVSTADKRGTLDCERPNFHNVAIDDHVARDHVALVEPKVPRHLLTRTEVVAISKGAVVTEAGERFRARAVIDCRGPTASQHSFAGCGYQKFFGVEISLNQPWPQAEPIVMDGLKDQQDGFRFIYTLPFTSHRVLVEDTRFSDSPTLNRDESLAQIDRYLASLDIQGYEIVREESGVLPMPFSSELLPAATNPLAGGYAGGWFHAATGYSFPLAVAFAEAVASVGPHHASGAISDLASQHHWQAVYARFLNRLLFRLVAARFRYRIFQRFYRVLSDAAIARFYCHRFNKFDALRIVLGIPPTIFGLRPKRFLCSFLQGDVQ